MRVLFSPGLTADGNTLTNGGFIDHIFSEIGTGDILACSRNEHMMTGLKKLTLKRQVRELS